MTAVTHQSLDTEYSADSIEWCPIPGYQDLLLCGTYQLQDNQQTDGKTETTTDVAPQQRVGRLYVYQLLDQKVPGLNLLASHELPAGILDIKWSQQLIRGYPYLGLVTSHGQLKVFSVRGQERGLELEAETDAIDGCLYLSLDWNNTLANRDMTCISVSDSLGDVHLYQLSETGLESLATWKAHGFEAWITAFDQWNTHIVYSGGDDCRLKVWDTRMEGTGPVIASKRHSMGVTSVQSNPVKEHILATGSYDEQLLVWDGRQMKQPLTDVSLGGGVWRIKWHPTTASHILTATMYNGFHVINTTDTPGGDPGVDLHYTGHESIAYGADWCRRHLSEGQGHNHIIATCSFYDHLLKLWTYDKTKPGE